MQWLLLLQSTGCGASVVAALGLSTCGSQAPERRLSSCDRLSFPGICGIFSDHGLNLCLLIGRQSLNHWAIREVQCCIFFNRSTKCMISHYSFNLHVCDNSVKFGVCVCLLVIYKSYRNCLLNSFAHFIRLFVFLLSYEFFFFFLIEV